MSKVLTIPFDDEQESQLKKIVGKYTSAKTATGSIRFVISDYPLKVKECDDQDHQIAALEGRIEHLEHVIESARNAAKQLLDNTGQSGLDF
jgi:hypothetical protein